MPDLRTSYMGIELKNPIILGACNLSEDIDTIKMLENEGIAAVVFKSLFEEQIILEKIQLNEFIDEYSERNAEMVTVFPSIKHAGPKEHLFKLKKLKNAINIPLIASLNCIHNKIWVDYAKLLEETGIDGLELNFYSIPPGSRQKSCDFEKTMFETVAMIESDVTIPISIKMNYFYTNLFEVLINLEKLGIKGFVFFNRLFTPDINIKNLDYFYPMAFSCSNENNIPLRFTGMLSGKMTSDICASTGIYESQDIMKMLLAGAACVQTVSSVYKNKFKNIPSLLKEIIDWMDDNGFKNIHDFKGILSKESLKDPFFFEREQYIDILNNNETIIKKEFRV